MSPENVRRAAAGLPPERMESEYLARRTLGFQNATTARLPDGKPGPGNRPSYPMPKKDKA